MNYFRITCCKNVDGFQTKEFYINPKNNFFFNPRFFRIISLNKYVKFILYR